MKRIGLVGAGGIGRWHAERWQRLPVELAGFYDVVTENSESLQASFGGKVYDSLEALLDDVDVVDICTITTAHKQGVLAAAAAGKAIICEKPLARTVADCQEMVDACEAAGVPLFVAQVVRFFPQFARAKAVLAAGQIGEPGVIRTIRAGSPPYGGTRGWFSDVTQSGGVIMDVGIHDIDYARWCMGEVERVYARGNNNGLDHALITLRFTSGAIGHIESSWAHPKGQFMTRLEIAGTEGLVEWDSRDDQPLRTAILVEDTVERGKASPLAPIDDPYFRELAHFLDCLENDKPFLVSPHDGLMAVKVSLAALAALQSGKPVDIDKASEVVL